MIINNWVVIKLLRNTIINVFNDDLIRSNIIEWVFIVSECIFLGMP